MNIAFIAGAVAFSALGLVGLYFRIQYAEWVLFVGIGAFAYMMLEKLMP